MYIPLGIKTDYSLLKSLIKINDLISFSVENKITTLGILDDNLCGSIEFYDSCLKNNLKPLIGLDIKLNGLHIYLYAQDYEGYKTLLKINSINQTREVTVSDLKDLNYHLILVIPFISKELFDNLNSIFNKTFISYQNEYEKRNSLLISPNVIFLNVINCFNNQDLKYFAILDNIRDDSEKSLLENGYFLELATDDIKNNLAFADLINIEINKDKRYIPHYDLKIKDSFNYLLNLCQKGLAKRLNNSISIDYQKRLNYELKVIKDMGFVDYFLIVYDYVKYAKTHDIMVGPGRGSAAGSLVSYAIGITNIDPLKYNLLFERFLNPQRITMPDIDVDFEDTKIDL